MDGKQNLAWRYLVDGKPDEAFAIYQTFDSRKEHTQCTAMNMAHLYLAKNEIDQAIPLYKKSIELFDDEKEFSISILKKY